MYPKTYLNLKEKYHKIILDLKTHKKVIRCVEKYIDRIFFKIKI